MNFSGNKLVIAGATSICLALAACSSSGAAPVVTVTAQSTVTVPGPTVTVTETATPEATASTSSPDTGTTDSTTTSGGSGSVDSPFGLGSSAVIGDWNITVVSYNPHATSQVMAANSFNDKPGSGNTYGLIRVKATYEGSDKGNAGVDIRASFVGSDSREYTDSDCGAVTPRDMSQEPDVFKNGKVDGTFCVKGPTSVLSGKGAISISTGFGSDPMWWSPN